MKPDHMMTPEDARRDGDAELYEDTWTAEVMVLAIIAAVVVLFAIGIDKLLGG